MPLTKLLNDHQGAFDPDGIKAISEAFEKVCASLGLKDRGDAIAQLVAKKVIEAAQTGERDPLRIYQITMETLSAGAPGYPGWPQSRVS